MTKHEREEEMKNADVILPRNNHQQSLSETETESELYSSTTNENETPILNFSEGVSSVCLDKLVQQSDLMKSRERIKKEQMNGKSVREMLEKARKVTLGAVFKCGTNCLGKTFYDVCKENTNIKLQQLKEKLMNEEKKYLQLKLEADKIMSKEGFCINKCSSKQMTLILKSLKRKGDVKLPSRKKDMIQAYEKMKNREPMTFDYTDINKMFLSDVTAKITGAGENDAGSECDEFVEV